MRSIPFVAALCVGFTTAASAETVIPGVSDLVFFGDSLSDPGNAFAFTGGTTPDPNFYPNGQFTNGDTWAAQLGADFASGTNFAVGGAQARTDDDGSPDFAAQIASFQAAAPSLGDSPVAVVAFGGNDLRAAFDSADPDAVIAEGVVALATGLQSLIGLGFTDLLVANVPDLGDVPGVVNTAFEPLATAATEGFNAAVAEQLGLLGAFANITTLDFFGISNDLSADPLAFGLTNTTEACLTSVSFCGVEAEGFAFFDSLHPTETIHTIWAEAAIDALSPAQTPAPVPLPAGAPLLLLGLAALGLVRHAARN